MDKKDIHHTTETLNVCFGKIKESNMSERQKRKILRFVEELQIGKAAKRKVGNHRIIAYLNGLLKLHRYFKKDFDKIQEKEAEQFYKDLETNRIMKLNGQPYKDNSKNELIKALKRYLGWIISPEKYRKTVGWIKDYHEVPYVRAIGLEDAVRIAGKMSSIRDRTLFMFLFDSGCRIEEALNVRVGQLEKIKKTKGDGEYYLVDIKVSKTLPRRISIPIAQKYVSQWLKIHPERNNENAFLFPVDYDNARKIVRNAGLRAIEVKITPHILRHSSATHYCKILNNPYKLCYRYGWTIGSREARRYIDRNLLGGEEQENTVRVIEADRIDNLERELEMLKQKYDRLFNVIKKLDAIAGEKSARGVPVMAEAVDS